MANPESIKRSLHAGAPVLSPAESLLTVSGKELQQREEEEEKETGRFRMNKGRQKKKKKTNMSSGLQCMRRETAGRKESVASGLGGVGASL